MGPSYTTQDLMDLYGGQLFLQLKQTELLLNGRPQIWQTASPRLWNCFRQSGQILYPGRLHPPHAGGNKKSIPSSIQRKRIYFNSKLAANPYTRNPNDLQSFMPAGVSRTISSEGKTKTPSGKIILIGALCASSSARCLRFTRI